MGMVWMQALVPLIAVAVRAKVILLTEYTSPIISPCRTIVVFYDTLFWRRSEYPQWFRQIMKITALYPARRRHTQVVTIATTTAKEVKGLIGKETRPCVLWPSVAEIPSKDGVRSHLLHVGVLEKRKNIPSLVRAYALARQGETVWPDLILAGPRSQIAALDDHDEIAETIRALGLEDSVQIRGGVTDYELNDLYSHSIAFIFASTNEGFGIPLVEAMSAGVPVVAVTSPVTQEVTGGAALTVPADSVGHLAEAIRRVVGDQALREQLSTKGRERARHFAPEVLAEQLRTILLDERCPNRE